MSMEPPAHLGTTEVAKSSAQILHCGICDYTTSRKCNFDKHLSTGRHNKLTNASLGKHGCACGRLFNHKQSLHRHKKACDAVNNPTAKVAEVANSLPKVSHPHQCPCGRAYKHASSLSKHKKTCLHGVGDAENVVIAPSVDHTQVLEVLQLLQEKMDRADEKMDMGNELLRGEMDAIRSGVLTAVAEPKIVNNINFFLNERCGNAIPIQDFVGGLAIGMEDVNYALENGKANGIANIIEKRIDELGMYKRPLHCTDVKRGTMYVKGAEGWGKEKGEMTKLIQDVNHAQVKGIKIWEAAHPRCFDAGYDREKDKWFKIVKCLTNDIAGVGTRKISKRCYEVSKINQEEMV